MPRVFRAGVPGKQGFPTLGTNEAIHREDGVTEIILMHGAVALIDTEDYPKICDRRWHRDSMGFVGSTSKKPIRLHRAILDGEPRAHIDHINHDRMDNRRSNLRWASYSQNQANRFPLGGTSDFKGVCWDTRRGKWRATIKKDRRQEHLGYFVDEKEAARAYNDAARLLFGEFALLNPE